MLTYSIPAVRKSDGKTVELTAEAVTGKTVWSVKEGAELICTILIGEYEDPLEHLEAAIWQAGRYGPSVST